MGNAFVTKGSTIQIGSDSTEIKAIVVEDFDIGVGEQAEERVSASDGTDYIFIGDQDTNDLDVQVLLTDDTLDPVTTAVYGAGGTIAGGTQWEMRDAGAGTVPVEITTPASAGGQTLKYVAVNARGVVLKPGFQLQKGFQSQLKFVCDYWIQQITE